MSVRLRRERQRDQIIAGERRVDVSLLAKLDPIAVHDMAQSYVGDAMRTLHEIMTDQAAPASARVTAASLVLDRALGKVAAKVESKHTDMTQLHLAAMRAHLSQQKQGEHAQVIDNTGVST